MKFVTTNIHIPMNEISFPNSQSLNEDTRYVIVQTSQHLIERR